MNNHTFNLKIALIKTMHICIGLLITGIGTAFMYDLGWGSAPAATISDGAHVAFGLTYGVAGIACNLFFLGVLAITDRKLISVGTVLATFFLGFFIDAGIFLISPLHIVDMNMPMRAFMLVIGCVLTAIGLGYYVGIDFGIGAIDGLSVMLNSKTKLSFRTCRWIVDILLMIAGVAMGAAWGIGTIVSIAVTGPIMQVVIRWIKKSNLLKNPTEDAADDLM
jgi:uncharacterized protein